MRTWRDACSDGGDLPPACAFGPPDPASRVALSDECAVPAVSDETVDLHASDPARHGIPPS